MLSIPTALADLAAGHAWVAATTFLAVVIAPLLLIEISRRPERFAPLMNALFVVVFVLQLLETAMFGGLLASGLVVIFGMAFVLGSLVAIGLRAAIWWFAAFAASVVYAVVIPTGWIRSTRCRIRRPTPP